MTSIFNIRAALPPISSELITCWNSRIAGENLEIAKICFGTKAETLERLQSRVDGARVLPQLRFTVDEWNSAPEAVCHMVAAHGWEHCPVIVRSSALSEDSATQSLAGRFTSVANVLGKEQLRKAVAEVIDSFGHAASGDQFFIQPMIDRPTTSGVLFTRDPATGAQYLIINYDDLGDTAAVTSGNGASLHMAVHVKRSPRTDPMIQRLASLSEELEILLAHNALDIEFAFDHAGELYLLQVRPLVLRIEHEIKIADHHRRLHCIRDRIAASMQRHPHLLVCSHQERDSLEGAIVAIPSADPGFDWIFSRKIAGFITAFGGANSHMAIRANELGVPAVIGTGELLYRRWSSARKLCIDCASQLVEIL